MIASYHWGLGGPGRGAVFLDVETARKSLGRMDRGWGDPVVHCAPDVWAALIEAREMRAYWQDGNEKEYIAARTTASFVYHHMTIMKDDTKESGTAVVKFVLAGVVRFVTIEDCV